MKTLLKLAVLAVASTAALAFAGNALAVQKLSVTQSPTSLTIKVSQPQTDPQPAKIQIFVPTGYTLNTTAAPGTVIGTTSGSVFARDANIPLPLSGDVVVAPPNTNAAPCFTGTHQAVWLLRLQVAGQSIQLPIAVDPVPPGPLAAFGSFVLVTCLAPADVPQGTPGRSPNGAQLLEAVFTVNNIFQVPALQATWKALTTPYTPGTGVPNQGGTVETRALVGSGTLSLTTRINKKKRTVRIAGNLSQAGAGVVGAQVRLLLNGKLTKFTARTSSTGNYSLVLARRKGSKKTTTTFQARVTVAERDVTSSACAGPTLPTFACVSATASGFTALSPRKKVRL